MLHQLQLPMRRGRTLGVDWICGLPVTAAGFDQLMVIVNLLSGKVLATQSKSTDNAAAVAQTLLDHSLRSGDGIPNVLVVDHDPKFTSAIFREFTKAIGSALIVGTVCLHLPADLSVRATIGIQEALRLASATKLCAVDPDEQSLRVSMRRSKSIFQIQGLREDVLA